tara:strand:+ start:769 stop:1344 length:576 start_codon:yes stop_codon:yes gene_type:complete
MLSTGDLVFFYGDPNCEIDKLIMDVTNSPYSHIGIIVKNPRWNSELKGTFLLQSSSSKNDAAEQKDKQSGVVLTPFSEYKGCKLDVRRLTIKQRDDAFWNKFSEIHARVHNHPYDVSWWNWLMAGLSHLGIHKVEPAPHTTTFWCSALCAYVYVEMGWLDSTIDWSNMAPSDLVSVSIQNGTLSPISRLVF